MSSTARPYIKINTWHVNHEQAKEATQSALKDNKQLMVNLIFFFFHFLDYILVMESWNKHIMPITSKIFSEFVSTTSFSTGNWIPYCWFGICSRWSLQASVAAMLALYPDGKTSYIYIYIFFFVAFFDVDMLFMQNRGWWRWYRNDREHANASWILRSYHNPR